MERITIAIDGYSSTGKSTLAKELAKKLGYIYIDTGAMYRAVTLFAMRKGYLSERHFEKQKLIDSLKEIDLQFIYNGQKGYAEVYLNQENVEEIIRTIEVSNFVSQVAELTEVRRKLVEQQQNLGKSKGVVMDGRDIGTVVFPDAELKIFMTAAPEIRAERRYKELLSKGQQVVLEQVFNNVVARDRIDTSREDSPLKKAADAVEIDNSYLTKEEQFTKVLGLAQAIIQKS